jgi:hypothetical protein
MNNRTRIWSEQFRQFVPSDLARLQTLMIWKEWITCHHDWTTTIQAHSDNDVISLEAKKKKKKKSR